MSVMVGNGKAQNLNIKFLRSKIKIEQIYLMLGTQHETGVLSRPNKNGLIKSRNILLEINEYKRRKITFIFY